MTKYKLGIIHSRLEFAGVEILTSFCFLLHNFGSRYARKSIQGSKDSDDSVISQQTWAKILTHWIGA